MPRSRQTRDDIFKDHEAVVIGISDYKKDAQIAGALGKIYRADDDARKVAATLRNIGYDPSRVHCLCNKGADYKTITKKLCQLRRQSSPPGLLVIFWAGHGFSDRYGRNYLLPWDGDLENLDKTEFTIEQLAGQGAHLNVCNLVLFLDTCYAKPNPPSLRFPSWQETRPALANQARLFVGASTYLTVESSRGGILTQCLVNGLTDVMGALADAEGVVHLDDLADVLRRSLRRCAVDSRYQLPYVLSVDHGSMPAIGRNLRIHIEKQVGSSNLPGPVKKLALLIAAKTCRENRDEPSQVIAELASSLLDYANHRIATDSYCEAHRRAISRILVSWCDVKDLEPYLPHLFNYCLEYEEVAPQMVSLVFQQLVTGKPGDDFVESLRNEWVIFERLNSVPWAYGIRTRLGREAYNFSQVIAPNTVIDPGERFSRLFQTTVEHQEIARLELLTDAESMVEASRYAMHLLHRVKLPGKLPKGQKVEVVLQRVREKGLKVRLKVSGAAADGEEWWVETSDGFGDLAIDVELKYIKTLASRETGAGMSALIQYCMMFLNQHWDSLREEDGRWLADWVRQTSRALSQRDQEGLASALRLLLRDLQLERHASKIFVMESLLAATSAPEEVRQEFDQLAGGLLSSDTHAALEETWSLVDEWRRQWLAAEKPPTREADAMELLLRLLDEIRVVMNRWTEVPPEDAAEEVYGVLEATGALLDAGEGLGLDQAYLNQVAELRQLLEARVALSTFTVFDGAEITAEVKRAFFRMLVTSGERFFKLSAAPSRFWLRFNEVLKGLIDRDSIIIIPLMRARIAELVGSWYEEWYSRATTTSSSESRAHVEVLLDFLGALDDPESTEEVVAKINTSQPFGSNVFTSLATQFQSSLSLRYIPEDTAEGIEDRLRSLSQLRFRWQQEIEFYQTRLHRQAVRSGGARAIGQAEAGTQPEGERVEREETRAGQFWRELESLSRVERPPGWAAAASPQELSEDPAELAELLEEISEEGTES